VFADKGIEF